MGVLIFLILLGLVVLLAPFILAGATYIIYYPPLLALVLFIFPTTRAWGVVVFVIWLIYFGIKESVKDSQQKKLFIQTARSAGYSRRDINKMIRTKKPNESWQNCISQLGVQNAVVATGQIIEGETATAETPTLDIDKALKFIGETLTNGIALKYALERKTYLNDYGLVSFSRDKFNTLIEKDGARSALDNMCRFFNGFVEKKENTYEEDNPEYLLVVTASSSSVETVDKKIEELRQAALKNQVKAYKDLMSEHKVLIEKYIATFVKLAQKVVKDLDKWGDYDESKIDELKKECIYKIYKSTHSTQYKEKGNASWSDYWIKNALDHVTDKPQLNAITPYWAKHLYDVDLPKALKAKNVLK